MSRSLTLLQTRINDNVRVSSAAIFYDDYHGDRLQYETWIFVKGHRGSRQVIHGNSYSPDSRLKDVALKYHRRVVRLLLKALEALPVKGGG